MIFKVPLSGGGLTLLLCFGFFVCLFFPIGTKHRVQSPLEMWPSMISMNRPKMESRHYEFLLQDEPLLFNFQNDMLGIMHTLRDLVFNMVSGVGGCCDCKTETNKIMSCISFCVQNSQETRNHIWKALETTYVNFLKFWTEDLFVFF